MESATEFLNAINSKSDNPLVEGVAEESIRSALMDKRPTIGKWYGITVKVGSVTRNFLASVSPNKNRSAGAGGLSIINLIHIKTGKLFREDEPQPIVNYFKLDSKNRLTETGYPAYASEEQLKMWKKEKFKIDKL